MKKLLRWFLRLAIVGVVIGLLTVAVAWFIIVPDLPEVSTLKDVRLQVPLRVYTADDRLIGVFGEQRRLPMAYEDIPETVKQAFIAGEDARFYEHPGVDWQGLTRAVWVLATTGEKSVGGSTITQQLARNFFLSFEKTYLRKIKEIFLAIKVEQELSKEEILALYLNKIYLGHRAYGVAAAADVYYGKTLDELTLAQAAMIAALPKAPSRINPINQPERAIERRDYVLGRMLDLGYVTRSEYDAAIEERDQAYYHGAVAEVSAPYVAEMVRAEMIARFGQDAYTGGYRVWTTIDSRLQSAANQAVVRGLAAYDQRHGYRGAEAQVTLPEDAGTDAWDEALAPYRPLGGLMPGLVTDVDDEMAMVYLRSGETVALELAAMQWARPFISRNRVGAEPERVTDVLTAGDVVRLRMDDEGAWQLSQVPEVEASLVSMTPRTGEVRALVGGFDFARSKFNRVTQSRRQPGSNFKPFLYAAALDADFTPASVINDAPIVFDDPSLERSWKPENYSEKFYGPTRLREALVNSRNLVSIRILRDIGIDYAIDYIARFGFDPEEIPRNLTMALGSATLTPWSMMRGFGVFANGGYLVEPWVIARVEDGRGQIVMQHQPPILCERNCIESEALAETEIETEAAEPAGPAYRPIELKVANEDRQQVEIELDATPTETVVGVQPPRELERVISEQNAWLVRSIMEDVIRRGTGRQALELERNDLAGKTGTTNDQRDAWFSGYNDDFVTTVWVGFDSHEPLGRAEVGGRAALPIWIDYMDVALEGVPENPRVMPDGLAQARIDPDTGLLAPLDMPGTIMEVFEAGHLPPMGDAQHGARADAPPEEDPYDIY